MIPGVYLEISGDIWGYLGISGDIWGYLGISEDKLPTCQGKIR